MKYPKGFTLVELLVVITIIGILIGLSLTAYGRVRERGRELQVQAYGNELRAALETFATNHNGLYPGVAFDINGVDDCNGDGVPERSFACLGPTGSSAHPGLQPALGVIGTDISRMLTQGPFIDGSPTAHDVSLWDRLYLDNALEKYALNPFYRGEEPKHFATNIFEVAPRAYADNSTPLTSFFLACLSQPDFSRWYTDPGWNRSAWQASPHGRIPIGPVGVNCESTPLLNPTGSSNGWEPANGNRDLYPVGDFAYIPLDPATRGDYDRNGRLDDPMFMVYVENYWLVLYGGPRRYGNTGEVDVDQLIANNGVRFYYPLGRVDPNDISTTSASPTQYEIMAMRALRGALKVHATRYDDQFRQ